MNVLEKKITSLLRSCIKKKRLNTRGYAEDRADSLGLRAYFCSSCFGFHLTASYDRFSETGAVDMIFRILTRKNGWWIG